MCAEGLRSTASGDCEAYTLLYWRSLDPVCLTSQIRLNRSQYILGQGKQCGMQGFAQNALTVKKYDMLFKRNSLC